MAVGVLHGRKPAIDELLVSHGLAGDVLQNWFDQEQKTDALLQAAKRKGVAVCGPDSPPEERSTLCDSAHVMMVVAPESLIDQRWWWLLLARRNEDFNEHEQRQAELIVRGWQTAFNRPDEADAGRMLVGHDNRLILADPQTSAVFLSHPNMLEDLLNQMHPIVQQRWPHLADNVTRDFAINLAEQPYWIRATRRRMIDSPEAVYWYIELRPLERGELPTVSVVPDERIARAIAFMHEEYQQSPSLSRIAQAVHISPFHFHRMFSKQVGVSPKHYLQGKQLQVAKWLLRSTRLPIGTIASRAGFASHGHFTSTFHRLVGMSPTEYREKS